MTGRVQLQGCRNVHVLGALPGLACSCQGQLLGWSPAGIPGEVMRKLSEEGC